MDENLFRQECKIQFELECQTQFKEEVFIVGDIPELGNWNPFNALKMITSQKDYPIWKLPQELIIPTHKKIEFKFIKKFEDSNQHNWEQFPNQMNRKYYTRYNKVVLQVLWNDYDGREIVYQRFQILPSQDRILDNFTKLQCKKQVISDTFDPFERAQDSDSDSSEEYSGGASDDFEYQYDDEDDSYFPDQNNMNNNLISMNNERNNIPVQYNKNNSPILEGDINLDNQYDLLQIDQEFNQQENFNQLQFQPDNNVQLLEQDNQFKNVDQSSNKNQYNQVVQQITNEIQKQNYNLINENILNENKTQIDQDQTQNNTHLKGIFKNCENKNENTSSNILQQQKSLNKTSNSVKQENNLDEGTNNLNKCEKKQQTKQVEEVQKQKNNKAQISQNNQQNQQKNPKVLDQRGTGNEYFLEKQESMGELEEEIKTNLLYLQNNLVQNKTKYQQLQQQQIQFETVENRYRNENQHVLPEQEKYFIQNQQTEIHSEQKKNKDLDDSPSQQVIKDSFNNTDNIQSNIQFDKLKDIYKMYGSKNLKKQKIKTISINESLYDLVGESNNDFYNFKHSEMDNILFCHFFLPLKIIFSDASDQWSIQFDDDTLLYHYYQAFPNSIFIGIISNYYEFSPDQWPQIEEELRNYNCLPVFIENEKIDKFLLEFCYPVLDPMMNNELDGTDMTLENTKTELWELFQEICKKFSEAIRKLQNENSYIFFLDHRILLTISYISFYTVKPSILYFSYGKFPHIQTFSIFPYHKDLINAILNADLINFIEYEQSINFFPIVRQIYGIKLYSRRGILQFNMQGRNIVVNMKHPGVNVRSIFQQLDSIMFNGLQQQIAEIYRKKTLIVGVDYLQKSSNLILKMKLVKKLLKEYPNIKFVQLIIMREHSLKDEGKLQIYKEIIELKQQIIENYPNQVEIIFDYKPQYHRLAYFYNANILLKTSNYSLTDIFIYEFMLVNNHKNGACMYFDLNNKNKLYHSLYKFNPLSYNDFKRVIDEILQSTDTQRFIQALNQDKKIIQQENNSQFWIQTCITEFKRSQRFMVNFHLTGIGQGTQFMKIAHNLNFKKLNISLVKQSYSQSENRLFLFGFEGTIVNEQKYNYVKIKQDVVKKFKSKPSEKIFESIQLLAQDKKNTVFIITELPKEFLDIWFSKVPNLGLACESGYIYKVVKQKTPLQKIKQIIEKNQNSTKQQIWTKENQSSIQLDEFQQKGEIKLKELNKILMERTQQSNNAITSNLSQQNGQSKDNENESDNQTVNAKENDFEMDKEKQINKKNSQLSFLLKKSLILKDLKERTLQRSHSGSKEYFIQNPSINLNQTREQSIKNTKIDNYEEQNSEDWEYLKDINVSWKVKVLQVMENFVLRTQGSKIFNKESSIIWSCQGVNQIFAQKQQEKLIEQLNIVTEEYDVQIIIQNTMVEVRSYGINKGTFIDLIIVQKYVKQGPIDFILCCGRGPSGEEMFQSIQKNLLKNEILHYFRENINVYPVVVDLKPSHANYYIKDQKHMENLLYVLSHKVQDN